MDSNLQKFIDDVTPFLEDWKSVDFRLVAHLQKDGSWIYDSIRVALSYDEQHDQNLEDLPNIPGLMMEHTSEPISKLKELLESISQRELPIQGRKVLIKSFQNQNLGFWYRPVKRSDSFPLSAPRFTFYAQSNIGEQFFGEEKEHLEGLLRIDAHPWDGAYDLARNFLEVSENLAGPYNVAKYIEVLAPIDLKFDLQKPELEGAELVVPVTFGRNLKEEDIALSVILFYTGGQKRFRITQKEVLDGRTVFRANLPGAPIRVITALSYKDVQIDTEEFFSPTPGEPNPRLKVANLFFEDQPLSESLEISQDRYFEDRISILFHMLGYSTVHYGRAYSDSPDVLAFADPRILLVIECTQEEIDLNNHISKLATRTKMIGKSLHNFTILPVVATKLTRDLLNATDVGKAHQEGVTILTIDTLQRLVQMAEAGTNLSEVHRFLQHASSLG